jgi:8-oxo-dGTP pyrophosphatase MutT (NUDIX family)
MQISCGAILYSVHPKTGEPGIILGKEGGYWLPFKGGPEKGETIAETARRELTEETFALVQCDVDPTYTFSSRNKKYFLGACFVDFEIVEKFNTIRKLFELCSDKDREMLAKYAEKSKMRFFTFRALFKNSDVHKLSKYAAKFFKDEIMSAETDMFPEKWRKKRMA